MINGNQFVRAASNSGIRGAVGVPCTYLTGVYNAFVTQGRGAFTGATSEGEAVAIASGAWLAGRCLMVMCQNSGLGNMVNPLTSLSHTFAIPLMLLITWRGRPGFADEPQHEFMGRQLCPLLDALEIHYEVLSEDIHTVANQLARLRSRMDELGRSVALILPDGIVEGEPYRTVSPPALPQVKVDDLRTFGAKPARIDVLRETMSLAPDDAVLIATTGKTGRELYTLGYRSNHLYIVGSMGCASALGLGIALHCEHPVVVLDGDGAALMKLGNWATIGGLAPPNLIHVLLENGVHDSTGGQATNGTMVDFAAVAMACRYNRVVSCDDAGGYRKAFQFALQEPGLTMIVVHIRPGSVHPLARPDVAPPEAAKRFRAKLCELSGMSYARGVCA